MLGNLKKAVFVVGLLMVSALWGQSQAAILQVNFDGSATYTTIQAAIDDALDGDTVVVASGHYMEQLVIQDLNTLFITGSGIGATYLDSPAGMPLGVSIGSDFHRPVALVFNCTGIEFSDLTLDGLGQGNTNFLFHGFGYFNSSGALKDLHITGMRDTPLSATEHGNGVFAVGLTGDPFELTMTNVLIEDFQKTGVLLDGLGLTSTSTNVDVVGQGVTSTTIQNGWQVSSEAELTASDCDVSEIAFVGGGYTATGLVGLTGTKLTMSACDFDACQTSMYLIENTTVFDGGSVTNPVGDALVGYSFGAKDLLDRLPAQPVVINGAKGVAKAAFSLSLTNSTFTGVDLASSWGVAILSGDQAHFTMDNVDISHFDWGFVTHEGGGVITGQARNCNIFDNVTYGGYSSTAIDYDALYNDWGDPSGPYHPTKNPLGLGNELTDHILFGPFNGGGSLIIIPVVAGPVACGEPVAFTVTYIAGPATPDLFLYNIEIRGGVGLSTPDSPVSLNPWGGTEQFLHYDNGDGSYTVSGSTVGGSPQPLTGPGVYDLFTIEVSATTDGGGTVSLEDVTLRDPSNVSFPSTLSVSDIIADCIAPAAVTNITAAVHHNRIGVTWQHDGLDLDHYEVFSGVWHDGAFASVYPEYDDIIGHTIPTRPADYAAILANTNEWTDVGDVNVLTLDQIWADSTNRGVYYYEVFAVDAVGNASAVAATTDRATNYWLGDVDGDGFIDVVGDISTLGAALGESEGDLHYNPLCDVGPTDDWSRLGIPTTDNIIQFEDLMVFSMNFGVVSDINKADHDISTTAQLAWVEAGEGRYALRLIDGVGIKGVHVQAGLPEGKVASVMAGQLLDSQSEMTFLKNIGSALDVNVAVMGQGNGFIGSGDLFVVDVDAALDFSDLKIELRGHDNSVIEVSLDGASGTVTPRVFALKANYPNPFNPMTKISFSLPEAQYVIMNVYSVDGTRVASLINETRTAGLHEVLWTGRDDAGQSVASGIYFYRIEAGPYSQVRKMTLMK